MEKEEQLDFPVLYASAIEGWASTTFTKDPPADARNMSRLLDAIISHVVKLMKKQGTHMVVIECAGAGDIVSMAGLTSRPSIGHTVASVELLLSQEDGKHYDPVWGRRGFVRRVPPLSDRPQDRQALTEEVATLKGQLAAQEVAREAEIAAHLLAQDDKMSMILRALQMSVA
ncbi:unnamed protein product [Malus baccata var. baccata]